jgi:hypothetical protein
MTNNTGRWLDEVTPREAAEILPMWGNCFDPIVPGTGRLWTNLARNDVWDFDYELWECLKCEHTWDDSRDVCSNCHDVEKPEAKTTNSASGGSER